MKEKTIKILTTILTSIVYLYLISQMIYGIVITNNLYVSHFYTINQAIKNYSVFGFGILMFLSGFGFGIYFLWFKKK